MPKGKYKKADMRNGQRIETANQFMSNNLNAIVTSQTMIYGELKASQ